MYRFQAIIHARPAGEIASRAVVISEHSARVCELPPSAFTEPFERSFEEASDALAALPRMFIELDGSFVWPGEQQGQPWQLDGVLYDRQNRLAYVEVGGTCPLVQFDEFLLALGWPTTPLVFQLRSRSLFVDEAEFRRLAELAAAH